jgi:uncharacterized repeat protein (TIGR03803 family)
MNAISCSLVLGVFVVGLTACGGGGGGGASTPISPVHSASEVVLYSFGSTTQSFVDGSFPNGDLIQASDGNFYGTTSQGGANNHGTVFKLTPQGIETVLWSFGSMGDGSGPYGSLIADAQGNLYGMTAGGGAYYSGTIFKIDSQGVESVLWSFGSMGDGSGPYGSLIADAQGNLYGMTYYGGVYGAGTVFKLTLGSTVSESVLWSFGGTGDGQNPQGSLMTDAQGNLYGMTVLGGANNAGTIFKLTLGNTVSESVLWSFGGSGDGKYPYGNLIADAQGNLYGMTSAGGANTTGTIFKFDKLGVESVLWSFNLGGTGDAEFPNGSLLLHSDGNLYGMTNGGGAFGIYGSVFKLTLGNNVSESVLWSFGGTGDGKKPNGSLILGSDGNLYGMTNEGGANGVGAVVRIKP